MEEGSHSDTVPLTKMDSVLSAHTPQMDHDRFFAVRDFDNTLSRASKKGKEPKSKARNSSDDEEYDDYNDDNEHDLADNWK